jgi:aminoglycoside phosphotransferase (APT) family kinase protein
MDEQAAAGDLTLDPLAILRALDRSGPAQIVPVSGGADTAMWRIEQDDRVFALRVFRPEQTAMAHREVAAMDLARAGGIPVPAVHAEGSWKGCPALLLTWMPGTPLLHELVARPSRAWALGVALGRTQAAIHAISVPPGHFAGSRSWIDWGDPDDALRQLLRDRAGDHLALLHLDLHPMNVLVEGREITAVLDWANVRSGDPRADLARTASIIEFAPLLEVTPAPAAGIVRRLLRSGWRHGYREAAGPIRGMAPFYSWAALVMVKDLSPRLGRQNMPWITYALLSRVRAWGAIWRSRAGLTT